MTRTLDPYDELAALFLTTEAAPPPNGVAGPVIRELIMVGHLPVRGGLWLAPYADAVARDFGATALLRLDDEPPHAQVFHGPVIDRADPAALREVVTALSAQVRRWIVRPPADSSLAELVLAGAERITILSSADEAARVTAYRMIKDLHLAAARVGGSLPHVGVALLGCDEATGQRVFDRLQRTARTHLEVEVSLDLCLPRMDAGIASSGWRRCIRESSRPTLERVMAWTLEAPPPADPPPAMDTPPPFAPVITPGAAPITPEPDVRVPEREMLASEPVAPVASEPVAPVPVVRDAGADAEPWVGRRTVKLRPKAETDVEPKAPCMPREPDESGLPMSLAAFVEGLLALPVRCPHHEPVELAVDERGRMHLLGPDTSLRDMAVVRRWALDHRELLAMACPEHVIDPTAQVRLHIFAARPLDVSDLHGSDVHLHVLAPVDVDGKRGWYVAELNRVR